MSQPTGYPKQINREEPSPPSSAVKKEEIDEIKQEQKDVEGGPNTDSPSKGGNDHPGNVETTQKVKEEPAESTEDGNAKGMVSGSQTASPNAEGDKGTKYNNDDISSTDSSLFSSSTIEVIAEYQPSCSHKAVVDLNQNNLHRENTLEERDAPDVKEYSRKLRDRTTLSVMNTSYLETAYESDNSEDEQCRVDAAKRSEEVKKTSEKHRTAFKWSGRFTCDVCNKRFDRKVNLQQHKKLVHSGKLCHVSGTSFTGNGSESYSSPSRSTRSSAVNKVRVKKEINPPQICMVTRGGARLQSKKAVAHRGVNINFKQDGPVSRRTLKKRNAANVNEYSRKLRNRSSLIGLKRELEEQTTHRVTEYSRKLRDRSSLIGLKRDLEEQPTPRVTEYSRKLRSRSSLAVKKDSEYSYLGSDFGSDESDDDRAVRDAGNNPVTDPCYSEDNSVTSSGSEAYSCMVCQKSFKYRNAMVNHREREHPTSSKYLKRLDWGSNNCGDATEKESSASNETDTDVDTRDDSGVHLEPERKKPRKQDAQLKPPLTELMDNRNAISDNSDFCTDSNVNVSEVGLKLPLHTNILNLKQAPGYNQMIRYTKASIEEEVEQIAIEHPNNLYLIWSEKFSLDLALAVARNRSNCILVVKNFWATSLVEVGNMVETIVTSVVKIGPNPDPLRLFSFGRMMLPDKILDNGKFKSVTILESTMRKHMNVQGKKLVNVLKFTQGEDGWFETLKRDLKEELIITNNV